MVLTAPLEGLHQPDLTNNFFFFKVKITQKCYINTNFRCQELLDSNPPYTPKTN